MHDDTTETRTLISRRHALVTGAVGAAATAFLAACGDVQESGRSGTPTSTTEVAPTVPKKDPSKEALEEDVTLLRTATSLELLVADVYDTYGSKLDDAAWATAAERFSADHANAAQSFAAATAVDKRVDEPNKSLLENTVEPVASTLTSDRAILDLFRDLESTLAATYVDAAGTFTTADWRARVMTFASASARRVTVLSDGGDGAGPTEAMYPLNDLIPGDAYVLASPKPAGPS